MSDEEIKTAPEETTPAPEAPVQGETATPAQDTVAPEATPEVPATEEPKVEEAK